VESFYLNVLDNTLKMQLRFYGYKAMVVFAPLGVRGRQIYFVNFLIGYGNIFFCIVRKEVCSSTHELKI